MGDKVSRHVWLAILVGCVSAPVSSFAHSVERGGSEPVHVAVLERPPLVTPGSLGLWLVGIVVTEEPESTLAVIEHAKGREQSVYREGERADGVLIKRILRNELIVDAGEGDMRLPLQHGPATTAFPVSQEPVSRKRVQEAVAGDPWIYGRRTSVHLDRNKVASALTDINKILWQVELSPVTRHDRPAGFRITNIPAGTILARLGLRNGDIVKRLDDQEIVEPAQAPEFLRRIRQGGQLTVTVNKRRRTRRIFLDIR